MTSSRATRTWRCAVPNGRASARAAPRFPAARRNETCSTRVMKTTHILFAAVFAWSGAFAQERGNTPPGQSQDGSRPQDGAIVGGQILPGEKSGMPDAKPTLEEREKRCMELSG